MKNKNAKVYTTYIGRYVTRIWTTKGRDIWQNDGTELNLEGQKILLALKFKGYDIEEY